MKGLPFVRGSGPLQLAILDVSSKSPRKLYIHTVHEEAETQLTACAGSRDKFRSLAQPMLVVISP